MYIPIKHDIEKQKILGIISNDMYYILKMRELHGNYYEQKRLWHLQYLEKYYKEKEAKEQEKVFNETLDKKMSKFLEKELYKKIKKAFS
ncbi:MAG: hypothetical protein E7353_09275 [Clostridiales bacterium]|nr:hypothetical protein [Clostridiales bacterium]